MIRENDICCQECGGVLKYYDRVKRVVRGKRGQKRVVKLRRFSCECCGRMHRELTKDILPFKQYEAEIIQGVIEHLITSSTIGFEDYPCEMTMSRWLKLAQITHPLMKGV